MDESLGVYIHIPFCASRCGYCDFCTYAGRDNLMHKYQHALETHILESSAQFAPYLIDTVYFGGGTPSYFGARRICDIFNALKRAGRVLKDSEVTVEVNPDSVTRRDLSLLKREGVNRLSIGVQSANPELLKLIGRRHNFKQAQKAVKLARAADFDNISLDLMYGLPSQTRRDWADTLARAIELRPEHISLYGLKLEEGTPMYEYTGSAILPDDDEQADMYLYAVEAMERNGFGQYEISNFCTTGHESKHNMKYWRLEDYMGFGPAAHSCVSELRYSYVTDIDAYINGVATQGDILDEYETITSLDKAAEYIMLGMRTTHGISQAEYYDIYRSDFSKIEQLLRGFEKRGWSEKNEEEDRWSFTSTGFLLSNVLIGAMLEAQAEQKLATTPWVREGTPARRDMATGRAAVTGGELFFAEPL